MKKKIFKGKKWKKKMPVGINLKTFLVFKKKDGININYSVVNSLSTVKNKVIENLINSRIYDWKKSKKVKKLGYEKKGFFAFLRRIRNYKYYRHKFKLPVNGQRTKTNARTQRKFKNYKRNMY